MSANEMIYSSIERNTLTRMANSFRESRGITQKLTTEEMIAFAEEVPDTEGSGESKLNQFIIGNLTELTANDLEGATKITDNAFQRMPLTDVELPEGISSIGEYSFGNCSQLSRVILPSSLKRTAYGSFYECSLLTSIDLPEGMEVVGSNTFMGTGITHITIPSTLTNFNFGGMRQLKTVTIPEGITTIYSSAFGGCSSLESIKIPSTVTTLGYGCFQSCSSLTEITIPNSVTKIDQCLCRECTNLKTVRIGNGLRRIIDNNFTQCPNLTDIYIDQAEGSVWGAPWGAVNATIHWNTPLPSEGDSLISFYIDGVEHQAEEGMTWAEWCESEYNTIEAYYNSDGIFIPRHSGVPFCVSEVSSTDMITSGRNYDTYTPN